VLRGVRLFVDDEVLPVIGGHWERAEMPWPLIRRLGELGIVGEDIHGYACPGLDPISSGLVHMELNRGDGSLGTFLGVQAGLAMKSIAMLGSEEQKQRWLPEMARLEKLGAFALTEPDHGSDSVALATSATRAGNSYVLNGAKRWIGSGSNADVVVVWARGEDGQVHGFLVEKGTPGYEAEVIEGKGSLRAIWQLRSSCTTWSCRPRTPARRPDVQGHRPGPGRNQEHVRLGRARTCGGGVRLRAHLRQAARAVRTPLVQLSRSSRSDSCGCWPTSPRCSSTASSSAGSLSAIS
jgi:Acyl-CoA dehydrogenase, N-terminal domain/Acyl-CoA dehydrogenase, middle domain